jgi:hypothetical protein
MMRTPCLSEIKQEGYQGTDTHGPNSSENHLATLCWQRLPKIDQKDWDAESGRDKEEQIEETHGGMNGLCG